MTLTVQFYTMVAMVAMGVWLGIAMDTYSRFLHPRRSKSLWLYLNDVVFWLLQGLLVFYVLFTVNEGTLRLYVFLALLCGYAAYRALFQQLYRHTLERIIIITVSVINVIKSLITNLVYRPVLFILKLLLSLCMMLVSMTTAIFWFIIKLFWVPVKWGFLLLWRLIPRSIRSRLIKTAGIADTIKNYIKNWLMKFRK
ncbi:spore cortex biosynthesis protein YabQ [Guptibacillus algicola]|uniref:spore cortex biosynthesis protein YabQ n=1 Tax=Guptibacillus algicola TaxID=225844 RepID=UPI001CD51580|nr:spore cortex biosynthesis protein YabQ [Alkalihalobacillus algicola]